MEKDSRVYIAGHGGLVGSAVRRFLEREGYTNLIFKTSSELDLRDQRATEDFFLREKPDYVIDAAAKVGGIYVNDEYRADFLYDNLQMQNNLIHSSHKFGVKKLLFIGSNCMYPKDCPQPMKEEYLLTGKPEPTNEAFAIAKIAGVKLCRFYNEQYRTNFISVIPASMFGPNDNFDTMGSHFVPALIKKFNEAKKQGKKEVVLWGSGNPRRELMYVDDFAEIAIFLMENYSSPEILNIGAGKDSSILEIARLVKRIAGFEGDISFDESKPDGAMRKLLDVGKMRSLGIEPKSGLEESLNRTYEWFTRFYPEH